MAAAGAQGLLRGPQRIAPAGGTHHRELGEIDPRRRQRGRIGQMGRGQPYHPLASPRQGSQRGQKKRQLANALLAAQDLGQGPARPSPAGEFAIKGLEARRHGRRGQLRRAAEPDRMLLEDVFEGCHRYCIFIQYRR